jgi:hypothetical protein
VLYSSALITALLRIVSLKVLGKVLMKKGKSNMIAIFAYDRRTADISLALMTSKPRSTNHRRFPLHDR